MKITVFFTLVLSMTGLQAADCSWSREPNPTLVKSGAGFDVWVGGINHDIIAIKRAETLLLCDGIRDTWQGQGGQHSRKDGATGKGILAQDITIGRKLIAVVFGANLDLARLYGLSDSGVQVVNWPSRDGMFQVKSGGDEMLFTFGQNANGLWTRKVCWNGATWKSSGQDRSPAYKECSVPTPAIGEALNVSGGEERPNGPCQIDPRIPDVPCLVK